VKICEKHNQPFVDSDCTRCGGNGYTESDIEDMQDPISFHSNGECYRCKGSGVLISWSCPVCDDEIRWEDEQEDELMSDHLNNGRTER
jgi:DnaJ-class molecular chaperone